MINKDDREITLQERAEISRRKAEVLMQKKTKQLETLSDLKREIGIPDKGRKK
jgi:hypothetical protein